MSQVILYSTFCEDYATYVLDNIEFVNVIFGLFQVFLDRTELHRRAGNRNGKGLRAETRTQVA